MPPLRRFERGGHLGWSPLTSQCIPWRPLRLDSSLHRRNNLERIHIQGLDDRVDVARWDGLLVVDRLHVWHAFIHSNVDLHPGDGHVHQDHCGRLGPVDLEILHVVFVNIVVDDQSQHLVQI